MIVTPQSIRAAAPPQPRPQPCPGSQPGSIAVAHLQSVLAAFNACNLASGYLERGNIAAARRKLVQALASVNQVSGQGGAV